MNWYVFVILRVFYPYGTVVVVVVVRGKLPPLSSSSSSVFICFPSGLMWFKAVLEDWGLGCYLPVIDASCKSHCPHSTARQDCRRWRMGEWRKKKQIMLADWWLFPVILRPQTTWHSSWMRVIKKKVPCSSLLSFPFPLSFHFPLLSPHPPMPSVHYVNVNNLAQDSRIHCLTTGYDLCYKSYKICVCE